MMGKVVWAGYLLAAFLTLMIGLAPGGVLAQGTDQVVQPSPDPGGTVALASGPDYSAWSRVATRAESALETGLASTAILEGVRAELVDWRDTFAGEEGVNAARIATVREQIAALGDPPADDATEAPAIAARRDALNAQLDALRTPVILATEAFTRADGLISEIDSLIREREAQRLSQRGPSPLNPQNWAELPSAIFEGVEGIVIETHSALTSDIRRTALNRELPFIIGALLVGGVLLFRGRRWVAYLQGIVRKWAGRGRGVWDFLISLGQVVLPIIGLILITMAISISGVLGLRGQAIVSTLVEAGSIVIIARWLAGHLFDVDEASGGPLHMDQAQRRRGWLNATALGWLLGARVMVAAFTSASGMALGQSAVITFILAALVAFFLYRLGKLLKMHGQITVPQDSADPVATETSYESTLVRLVGQVAMFVAVVGFLAMAIGYAAIFDALVYPAVTTLAVFGVIMLLQTLVVDLYILLTRNEDGASDALVPLLIGFVLVLLSLPVLALVWGARVADLTELWVRFSEGFSIGATRISPTDFMTFAVVFALGYAATRLLQGTLRSTVLPKTKLDVGGQNAIVSGLGYVGILLAALIAITTAGIDLSGLAIVAGALSVGIGFGLQNIVSNFISGIILLIERPISQGDWIEVNGQMGYVRDISVRSTRIETFDRTDVIVPNADLISGQVTNWTRGNKVGRVIVPVGVAYSYADQTDRIASILQDIAEAHPMVLLNPGPAVIFQGFGADSLDFEIRAILRDVNFVLSVKSEMNHAIAKRFAEEGIEIPFAQRDLWLRNPEVLGPKE